MFTELDAFLSVFSSNVQSFWHKSDRFSKCCHSWTRSCILAFWRNSCSSGGKHGWLITCHVQQSMQWNSLSIPKLQRLFCWSLSMNKQFHHTIYNESDNLSMLGLEAIHLKKQELLKELLELSGENNKDMLGITDFLKISATHWSLHKLDAILQMTFQRFILERKCLSFYS